MDTLDTYTTQRNKKAPLVNGFKFRLIRKNVTGDIIYWKCSSEKCKAFCQTDVCISKILAGQFSHNHAAPPKAALAKSDMQASCKKRCRDEPDESPLTIVLREVKRRKLALQPHELRNARNSIYEARKRPLPDSFLQTVQFLHDEDFIPPDEDFFMSMKEDVLMFSFNRNIPYFSGTPRVFGDGTFDSRPPHCSQLYTLHTEQMEHYLPLTYFILQDKTIRTYVTMLQLLIEECQKRGVHFNPAVIHLDFEDAAHASFKTHFPDINIRGCNFHLKQAWLRKCQAIGLKGEYEDKNSAIHRWIRTLFGLAFLNPDNVQTVFAFDMTAMAPMDPRVEILEEYLTKNYCMDDSKYPPQLWASANLDEPRTTNCCESFHALLKKRTGHRPNIFKLLRCLSDIQELTQSKMNAIEAGNPRFIPRKERVKRLRWQSFSTQYNSGIITRHQYVSCMSYKFV